jgi:hypothetical protein
MPIIRGVSHSSLQKSTYSWFYSLNQNKHGN